MAQSQALHTENTTIRAYIVLLIGVTAASVAAIFILFAQEDGLPSLLIAAGRLIVASILLTVGVFSNRKYLKEIQRLKRSDVLWILLSGFFLAIHFAAWVSSLEHTTVLIGLVLVSTSPIWVALLEIVFLKVRLTRWIITGMAIVIVGGLVIGLAGAEGDVSSGGDNQLLGAVLSIIGAIAVAVYLVIGRNVRARLSLTPYIWLVYGSAALILIFTLGITRTQVTGHPIEGYGWIILLGVIPQLIGHSSFNYALAYLPATLVSIASQMEPIFGTIMAVFFFEQIPSVGQVIGGIIIIGGVLMTILGRRK